MKYSEAIEFLDSKVVLGIRPSLDRIARTCQYLGNPQEKFESILITGTNGKTSVAHMVSEILYVTGFSVGRFTSPHLETVRERITINGHIISISNFAKTMGEIMPSVEKAERELGEELSYFETVTALALEYFARSQVDVAVLEVGMGGRWDATNIVDSDVEVITNVSLDHTKELGRTKKEIAGEKAGIIKEGSILLTSESSRDILLLFAERCEEMGCEMKVFGRDFKLEYVLPYRRENEAPAQYISILGLEGREFKDIKLPMIGKHQAVNAALAVACAQCYTDPRGMTSEKAVKKALEQCTVPGRIEILSSNPLVVADGAHNVHGVDRLAIALASEFEYSRLVIVVSILSDKDARGMLRILGSLTEHLILTENSSARCFPAQRLSDFCRIDEIPHVIEPDFSRAMKLAYNIIGKDGMICVTGSLYTVAEARIFFKHQKSTREMRQDR